MILKTIDDSHIRLKMEIHKDSPCLLKAQQKYNKIHVLWKCNKNSKSNLWYSTP